MVNIYHIGLLVYRGPVNKVEDNAPFNIQGDHNYVNNGLFLSLTIVYDVGFYHISQVT